MDRITFDFDNGDVIFDMDNQKGTITVPEIKEKKNDILKAAGLAVVDVTDVVRNVEAYMNGDIDSEEYKRRCKEIEEEERRNKHD